MAPTSWSQQLTVLLMPYFLRICPTLPYPGSSLSFLVSPSWSLLDILSLLTSDRDVLQCLILGTFLCSSKLLP